MAKRKSLESMNNGPNNKNFVANYGTAHDDDEDVSWIKMMTYSREYFGLCCRKTAVLLLS